MVGEDLAVGKVVMKAKSTSVQNDHAPSWPHSSGELSRPLLKYRPSHAERWVNQPLISENTCQTNLDFPFRVHCFFLGCLIMQWKTLTCRWGKHWLQRLAWQCELYRCGFKTRELRSDYLSWRYVQSLYMLTALLNSYSILFCALDEKDSSQTAATAAAAAGTRTTGRDQERA